MINDLKACVLISFVRVSPIVDHKVICLFKPRFQSIVQPTVPFRESCKTFPGADGHFVCACSAESILM